MEPTRIILWAICLGLAWILFVSITGADEWLRSLFGTSKTRALEERVSRLESRLAEIEKQK